MPVVYNATGNLVINLSIDFTHTVRDVERAIRYHTQINAKVSHPKPARSTEHILTLCARQEVSEIRVIVSE